MPGTVQVSVMEFKGLPSTCLKLSLGKREYQTSDTGDFLFPLTTLHDNLVVRLLDAEGNEIALTGIQTMSIVEKVSWDEKFPLDGGGHVHLRLQFVLNQEERNRIRLKREAAVKKKQESFSYISNENPEIATSFGGSVTLPPQAEQQVSGKRVMNLLGTGATEAKLHQKKNSSSSSGDTRKHGSDYEMKKREKESQSPRISRSESSSNDASGGLVGQVIKIAIIVGFGILVFFTRQREPRKSKRDTNDPFFTSSEYMDEHTTTAEQVD